MERKTLNDVAVGNYLILEDYNSYHPRMELVRVTKVSAKRFSTLCNGMQLQWNKSNGHSHGNGRDKRRIRWPKDGEITRIGLILAKFLLGN